MKKFFSVGKEGKVTMIIFRISVIILNMNHFSEVYQTGAAVTGIQRPVGILRRITDHGLRLYRLQGQSDLKQ